MSGPPEDFSKHSGPDKPDTYPGIYELHGDTLQVCFGDEERPEKFPTKGDKPALFIGCKRVKP